MGGKNNTAARNIDWTPAKDDRQAFKDEDTRMNTDEGGHASDQNYNQRASPGKNYKKQDGEVGLEKKSVGISPNTASKVGIGMLILVGGWEVLKWSGAILLAPETGGASLVLAAGSP